MRAYEVMIILDPEVDDVGVRATIDRATVVDHCVSRLAKFKIPNDIVIVDALPRNATGKVLKRELRTQFVDADAPKIS